MQTVYCPLQFPLGSHTHSPSTLPNIRDLMALNSASYVRLKSSVWFWSIWNKRDVQRSSVTRHKLKQNPVFFYRLWTLIPLSSPPSLPNPSIPAGEATALILLVETLSLLLLLLWGRRSSTGRYYNESRVEERHWNYFHFHSKWPLTQWYVFVCGKSIFFPQRFQSSGSQPAGCQRKANLNNLF